MPRYLTPTDLDALIRYATTPPSAPPRPHPLAADAFLATQAEDVTAHVTKILSQVQPYLERRPIRLSCHGFQRLASMYHPPSRVCRFYAWQSDLNQIERRPVPQVCPIPLDWYSCPGTARGLTYTPEFWHGQWIPHPYGRHHGCQVVWRWILPFPSSTAAPVTLDDLTAEMEARRGTAKPPKASVARFPPAPGSRATADQLAAGWAA